MARQPLRRLGDSYILRLGEDKLAGVGAVQMTNILYSLVQKALTYVKMKHMRGDILPQIGTS